MFLVKWKRAGSFIINNSINSMFYQIIRMLLLPFLNLTLNNIFIDILIIIFYLILYVITCLTIEYICFNLIKTTLGHKLMGLIIYENNHVINQNMFLKREFLKYYMIVSTLGLYILICAYNVFKSKKLYHELKTNSSVL